MSRPQVLLTLVLRWILAASLVFGAAACSSTGHGGARFQDDDFAEFDEFDDFGEFDEGGGEEDADEEVFDPLEPVNRGIFWFNDKFYTWVWDPVARGYRFITPEPVRIGIGRVFRNAATPIRFANDLFQLEFEKAGTELGRLIINSTLGLAGIFDPADAWFGLSAPPEEDFGQTLGYYGVGSGFPIVIPFLGPSNLRDGLSLVPDFFMVPYNYFIPLPASLGLSVGEFLNETSLRIGEYESLKADALDPYTFFRDAYEQFRQKAIDE